MADLSLLSQDFTAQIELVSSGQLSLSELHTAQQQLIEQVNPKLNAFIHQPETAELSSSNGPLAGVSITVKDNIDVLGMPTTAGLETRRHFQPQQNAFVIEKFKLAGANISGKLNMHEGALGASNHNSHYGDCFNPYDFDLTSGGSSGGSGAAVASCMSPLALGTDTMGSVRIPASYCGVFGYKPSRGAVSNRGSVTCSRVMDNIGPLARSARDLTLAANIMLGFDPHSAESQPMHFSKHFPASARLLVPENLKELGVDQSIVEDFEKGLKVFEQMGFEINTFSFDDFGASAEQGYDFGAARRAGLIICEADMRVEHELDWQKNNAAFSPYLNSLLSYIDSKSPMDVMKAERVLEEAVVTARKLFSFGHYLLMPTTPQRAFSMSARVPPNQADLTSFANQAGLCAVSMPMKTERELPAGMQLVGPQGSDFQLLQLAEQWQQHAGYQYQVPTAIKALVDN
ncbi:amidase [Thalassotalea sp. M1531]|uniref:Amidase n=1 Tax=Thalassotalea algicola TaxID=2716224 RepID=A0A7Y0LBP9_9GAMM|nr:amidase [Thalassotalea algicola]NMP30130.1 amidase [Thalassotalea algicola]